MSTHMSAEAFDPEPARQSLATLLEQVFTETLPSEGPCRAFRVEIPIKPVAARAWLRAQDHSEKLYWSDREGRFEAAGVGAADWLVTRAGDDPEELLARIERRLASAHPHSRYYGGLRFNPRAECDQRWAAFGACRFTLPRIELLNAGGQSYLACNVLAPRSGGAPDALEEALDALDRIQFPEHDEPAPALPGMASREDRPNEAGWGAMIERALDLFSAQDLRKVVLARESTFQFAESPDPADLLERLGARADRAYCFCFQPEAGTAFLGVSPERLYKRRGRYLESEAVAGTRPRGRSSADDEALGRDLLGAEKDVREHRYVVDALEKAFASLCGTVPGSEPTRLLKLPECLHLYRRIEGILSGPLTDAAILRALHPTPAVGGDPTVLAMDWIERLEPFDRGWYTGPVGWIGGDAAEFAVAIRCGLVHGASFSVYSGAGIVAGSTPASEWAEIENKMSNVAGILEDDDR